MCKKSILMCKNYIAEKWNEWYNISTKKLFAKESKFMKKLRVLALVIAVLSLISVLFLVSCDKNSGGNTGNCAETGNHKWGKWSSNSDATCTTDGTRSRKCPVCKTEEKETDPGTASGHYFVDSGYVLNDNATCTLVTGEQRQTKLVFQSFKGRKDAFGLLARQCGKLRILLGVGKQLCICMLLL